MKPEKEKGKAIVARRSVTAVHTVSARIQYEKTEYSRTGVQLIQSSSVAFGTIGENLELDVDTNNSNIRLRRLQLDSEIVTNKHSKPSAD